MPPLRRALHVEGQAVLHRALRLQRQPAAVNWETIAPHPTVECALPLCTVRLRASRYSDRQWCSAEHRALSEMIEEDDDPTAAPA